MSMDPNDSPASLSERRIDFASLRSSIQAKKLSKLALVIPMLFGVVGLYVYIDGRSAQEAKRAAPSDDGSSIKKKGRIEEPTAEDVMASIDEKIPDSEPRPDTSPVPTETTPDPQNGQDENLLTESEVKDLKALADQLSKKRIADVIARLKTKEDAMKSNISVKFTASSSSKLASNTGQATQPSPLSSEQAPIIGIADPAQAAPAKGPKDMNQAYTETTKRYGYLTEGKQKQISPYEIKASTYIPGIMISGINSDLPSEIVGMVSQNIYDTATGEHLLIPKGTKLMGDYNSNVAWAQERILIAWRRMIFPDGSTVNILNMSGVDNQGYGGITDQVDHHYLRLFGSAFLIGIINGGTRYAVNGGKKAPQESSPASHMADSVTEDMAALTNQMLAKNLGVAPTITVRAGQKFNLLVNRDMILEPYDQD